MKKRVVSAWDVARLANVSQSTVSRVFTPGKSVSEKTRKRVLEAADELNYRPNALARSLTKQKTNMVGLAMKDIQNPFYHEVLGMFSQKLRAKGYNILFLYTENEEIQQEELNHFLEYNVEGIIVTDAVISSKLVEKIYKNSIPVTLFNRYDKNIPCHSVSCDNVSAAKEIATYLFDQQIDDIVFITGKKNTSTNQERQRGFTEFFRSKNKEITILEGDYTYEKAYHLITKMVKDGRIPQAIFGANDITAIGAMDALRDQQVSIPEETIVIGFDNIKMADWPSYQLSTWMQPIEQMVDKTIELLTTKKNDEYQTIKLTGEFIHRKTTI